MRILWNLIILAVFLLAQTGLACAEGQTFVITADVPEVINGGIVDEGVVGEPQGGGTRDTDVTWDFGNLTFQSAYGIWTAPTGYYLVLNGDVTLSYSDTANPNQATGYSGHGLGYKATIAFKELNGTTETDIAGWNLVRPIRLMNNGAGGHTTFTRAQVHNHYLKFYVGVYDHNLSYSYTTGADAPELFTNTDHSGTYQGTLTITVVTP